MKRTRRSRSRLRRSSLARRCAEISHSAVRRRNEVYATADELRLVRVRERVRASAMAAIDALDRSASIARETRMRKRVKDHLWAYLCLLDVESRWMIIAEVYRFLV